ncbi:MAG: SGNH/GDSL hydrolase family protein [Nocardioides sp.]
MIVNSAALVTLCFGDSNTFGQRADKPGRWPVDVRWTGQLQELLGNRHSVIEEGLGGRTTDLDDPERDDCNGLSYFKPCLRSHSPLDLVVIMLGTNDLKTKFDREPAQIADALDAYVDTVESTAWTRNGDIPTVLLVAPIHLDATTPSLTATTSEYDRGSAHKSRDLGPAIRRVAAGRRAVFLDAATVASPGDDGIHLDRESHETLAQLIAQEIRRAISR